MQTWIALLRGINVGGNHILPMKNLRALVESLGVQNVRTYIQSGNCVFDCEDGDAPKLAERIAETIEDNFSFRPQVMVITKDNLAAALAGNPYPEGLDNPKSVHLYFLSEPAKHADLSALNQIKTPSEHFSLCNTVFYLFTPEGIGHSKLASQVEKHLKVPVTARNLRSAIKIFELTD
ncbi:MAG: DUF1697 domain-containing protein [Pseudomonadota bacterium]